MAKNAMLSVRRRERHGAARLRGLERENLAGEFNWPGWTRRSSGLSDCCYWRCSLN